MEIFDVEHPAVHGGSLRVFVQHAQGPHTRSQAVPKLLEEEAYLNTEKPYFAFATRIEENKQKSLELLRHIKKAGQTIAGYGAPAKATTLLYTFGIDGSLLDFIVDDSPLKQGRVMPGLHIPIVASTELYNRRPDFCLILAWNFAEGIMSQHQRFTNEGGKFIIPVPTPQII